MRRVIDWTAGLFLGTFVVAGVMLIVVALGYLQHHRKAKPHLKPVTFASAAMVVARTIGPRVTQPVLYQDAGTGKAIAAIITDVSRTDGTVTLVTFPPGAASATPTSVRYDYTGAVGTWRYHETDVV